MGNSNPRANTYVIGDNSYNQLGLKSQYPVLYLAPLTHNCKIVDIKCGKNYTIFIDEQNNIWCAGRNDNGQCGIGNFKKRI